MILTVRLQGTGGRGSMHVLHQGAGCSPPAPPSPRPCRRSPASPRPAAPAAAAAAAPRRPAAGGSPHGAPWCAVDVHTPPPLPLPLPLPLPAQAPTRVPDPGPGPRPILLALQQLRRCPRSLQLRDRRRMAVRRGCRCCRGPAGRPRTRPGPRCRPGAGARYGGGRPAGAGPWAARRRRSR